MYNHKGLNRNIRCIEIATGEIKAFEIDELNRNIRCIEII